MELMKSDMEFYYEVPGGEVRVSFSEKDSCLNLYETFVSKSLRGRGYAMQIVTAVLDYAAENNRRIIPTCPFIKRYIEKHPQYAKIVSLRPDHAC